jgi:hypothetical protein
MARHAGRAAPDSDPGTRHLFHKDKKIIPMCFRRYFLPPANLIKEPFLIKKYSIPDNINPITPPEIP